MVMTPRKLRPASNADFVNAIKAEADIDRKSVV